MKLFRFYSRYWAAIGGLVFVGLAFVLGIMGDQIPTLQRLTVLLFMALLFHQFEEYVFPEAFLPPEIWLFSAKKRQFICIRSIS